MYPRAVEPIQGVTHQTGLQTVDYVIRPQLTVPSLCVFAAVDVVAANLVLHYVGYIIIFTLLVTKIYLL